MNSFLIAMTAVLLSQSVAPYFVLVPGYTDPGRSIDAAKLGSANQVMVYQGGKPILTRTIEAGSDEDKAVAAWLRAHEGGWQTDFNSYAPSRQVRGERFTLNFHKGGCILNYRTNEKGAWSQVSRPLKEDEAIPDIFKPSR